ncbi:MAG: GAF domain-containing sensor histidine kinase [Drouetiella hepatica Uher 2000/2452]|jgi:hypothetical protein|uniref:histidine kinase n=1 Tax=Drouetiella hepatica Uher 2000/2452 TaxID=904376 RepID=A0A951UMG8_9CYAN|nr:GAF domain-containing sensor histidine kinase [Drouetiella hepatica Uher 2000/2452]
MLNPDMKLSCRLDHEPTSEWEQQRLKILEKMGLLELESVPVFEEATQTAAHFLDMPICILGVLDSDRHLFKSAVGLSRIGLMNSMASSRQLPRAESFCTYVVDSQQVLAISDTTANPVFANSLLTQRYGIYSYLGVPLMTSEGHCIGTLAVMGLSPRGFTHKEIELLQLTARWSMSEFERDRLLKLSQGAHLPAVLSNLNPSPKNLEIPSSALQTSAKTDLISQMTQELCTPLTSILGMARVLSQGIYGSLSSKQKEYIEIIHNSGQYLLSLVNEIIELGALDDSTRSLNLSPVDIEMLCQQAIAALNQAVQRREQQIQLTIEPGNRVWLLDKDRVRQMLYHLVFSVVQSSSADSVIRIHVSRRHSSLNLTIWTSHPWLGDGLPQAELVALHSSSAPPSSLTRGHVLERSIEDELREPSFSGQSVQESTVQELTELLKLDGSRQSLGLSLSRQLAEMHGGSISIRGSAEDGYRYVIKLPQMQAEKED